MQITFFQRKRRVSSYSLEFIFEDLRDRLKECVEPRVRVAPFFSNGFFRRLAIMLDAKLHEGKINHVTGDINFAGLLLQKNRTVISILDCSDFESRSGLRGWLLRRIWIIWPTRCCSVVTTISEASRQAILRISGCKPEKVIVIPVAVSKEFRQTPKTEINSLPRILQVGTSTNKNLERVIEALKDIACTLVIIGELNEDQRSRLEASTITYENFVGITTTDLAREYQKCDLLVFTSIFEGFGMPIVEAQTVGRPVVTSNVTSMPEVAGAGACLVDPLSIDSIKAGIMKVLNNSEYRKTLVSEGILNAKRFDAEEIAMQYHSVYRSLQSASGQTIKFQNSATHINAPAESRRSA